MTDSGTQSTWASFKVNAIQTHVYNTLEARPRGYKTCFMLNLADHEIFSANKYETTNNSWHFHIY